MLSKARERLPQYSFVEADIATWQPDPRTDLIFGNAVMQWLPDHPAIMRRLLEGMPPGGVLAIQMPDNTREPALMFQREVGRERAVGDHPEIKAAARDDLPSPEAYYDLLKPVCSHIDIWHSVYNHVMASPEAITEWFKGSSLQPFLSPLDAADREKFPRRLYEKYRRRLQAALRRQGAAAISAPVHPGGAMRFPRGRGGEGAPTSRPEPPHPTLSPLGRGGSRARAAPFILPQYFCCARI